MTMMIMGMGFELTVMVFDNFLSIGFGFRKTFV